MNLMYYTHFYAAKTPEDWLAHLFNLESKSERVEFKQTEKKGREKCVSPI